MLKRIFQVFVLLLILWIIGFLLLVRFDGVDVTGSNSQTIFGYDDVASEFVINGYKQHELKEEDGVYLIDKGGTYELLQVVNDGEKYVLESKMVKKDSAVTFNCIVGNASKDAFDVTYLRDHVNPNKSRYTTDAPVIVISDIEGNFNGFASFLMTNNVIDSAFNWVFGDGHLVLNGDFMDRGSNVTECLWLIYKLEHQAIENGGLVHFVLGNHEAMNLQGKLGYLPKKYRALMQELKHEKNYVKNYKQFLNEEFVLGSWLKQKNVVEKINETLFVHGGISQQLIESGMSLEDINEVAKANISKDLYGKTEGDQTANLVMGRMGPLWFRGLAKDYKDYYKKSSPMEFRKVLDHYQVEQIVIGHTVVHDIHLDFDGGLINIDVKHGHEKHTGKTKGILINKGHVYKVNDQGEKVEIKG